MAKNNLSNNKLFDKFLCSGFKEVHTIDFEQTIANYEIDYAPYLPEDKKANFLDIGCGMGDFLYYIKKKGYHNFLGIDIGREQIEFCKEHVTDKCELISDLPTYLREKPNTFDLIAMNNVIEHLPKEEILNILELVKRSLRKENGTLIISTGNISAWTGIYLRYKDFTHQIGFTEYSLRQILKVAGFSQIEVFGNKVPIKLNLKRLGWIIMRNIWFSVLKAIYLVEMGSDSPRIFSKLLIAIGKP